MRFLITGLCSFTIIFGYYYIFIISNKKKNKEQVLPKEAQILINLYKVVAVGYKRLLWHIALANSFGIGLIMIATEFFDSIWLKAGIAVGLVILMVLGINYVLGAIYKKKGWTK